MFYISVFIFINLMLFIFSIKMLMSSINNRKKERFQINKQINKFISPDNTMDEFEYKNANKIHTLSDNECNLNCCANDTNYTCSKGCVCLSKPDKKLLKMEGGDVSFLD